MKNNFLPLMIGLILAVAAMFMLKNYLDEQKKALITQVTESARNLQANQVVIMVARKPIPSGVALEPSMLDTTVAYRNEVSPNVVRSPAEIQDKATTRAISAGEPISSDALRTMPKEGLASAVTGAFSNEIPEGKLAVPLQADNVGDIIDKIKPGDHVDVIAIVPIPGQQQQIINVPIFQDVQVLAVGGTYGQSKAEEVGSSIKKMVEQKVQGGKKGEPAGGSAITVALDLDEANVISFVQEHGKVRLMIRKPTDTGTVDYQQKMSQPMSTPAIMNYDAFFQYLIAKGLMPPPRQPSPEEMQPTKPKSRGPEVEIYRGDKKEVKELIK